ncbi:hypothetical protein J5X91_04665 [Pseudoalteromonas sp. K222D]|uniref:hypothetical protein n=1 Tax=unclassified Pseudoalteromonas TaxID=194690 RepID=UPI0015F9AF83|nr:MULTISPECIES: hypothetical protein [unclassified Pseudoalteromonas]MBB1406363.1 hypothetical protein [Pseudoalteromonas sp. SG44-5]MBH0093034.1 hypothetical protein [Pseudoalteromonas sp. SCQQ13]MBO7925565.1 hypothetical protein [Pseudoalteromonas sp. K222D]
MKKLIVLSAIAALTSGAALAENLNVGGAVASICQASTTGGSAVLFPALSVGASQTVGVSIKCNDPDGAIVSLTTSEGHLQNADQEDKGVGYWAELNAAPYALTLKAMTGANDTSVVQDESGSAGLANGLSGTIKITIKQAALYSGTYADTLKLSIIAN